MDTNSIVIIVMAVWFIVAVVLIGVIAGFSDDNDSPFLFWVIGWPLIALALPFVGLSFLVEKVVRKLRNKYGTTRLQD